uniref:Uncharacterized protein n=1 Tax=Parascaris equorum TaxID=6256 RepID=A0A914RVM6_PAREQ
MFVEWAFVFFVTLILLQKFGNVKKQHIIVIVSTFIGWFSSFTIITILPEDIAVALYKRCLLEKTGWTDATNLTMKELMYWTAQLLTWIVLPLMQSYSNAGDFTVVGKLRSAAYNNVIYYGAYLIIFVCLMEHVKVMIISASNTWGLFMSVVLLGYGLVEVPRQLWLMGVKGYRLNKTYFELDKLSAEKNEAEDALKEVYQEARSVLSLLRNDHALRECAQIVLAKFPVEVVTQLTSSGSGSFSAASSIAPSDESLVASEKYLIRLHKRDVEHADDVWDNRGHCIYDFRWEGIFSSALTPTRLGELGQIGQQVSAVFSCLLSLVVIWSECTFFVVHPTLSIAAMLVDAAARLHEFGILMQALSSNYFLRMWLTTVQFIIHSTTTKKRNKMLRAANREQRDQYWAERLAGYGTDTRVNVREAPSKNAYFPSVREYGDDEPILSADECIERCNSSDLHDSLHANNGSPINMPPSNIFDDL